MLYTAMGETDRAGDCLQQSLTIFRDLGDRYSEAWVLNSLGEAAYAAGRMADAIVHHTTADTIARGVDARDQQARAHAGLAQAMGGSREHLERAPGPVHRARTAGGGTDPPAPSDVARPAAVPGWAPPRPGSSCTRAAG
jgi:hypothetical protein